MSIPAFADIARLAAAIATGLLGWTPDLFWRSTPRELLTALEGRLGPALRQRPLTHAELRRLMERSCDG